MNKIFMHFFLICRSAIFLFLLGIIGCANSPKEIQVPDWYINTTIPYSSYEYIGYGQGSTKEAAMLQAKSEIAQSIRSDIRVEVNSHTVFNDKVLKESFSSKTYIASDLKLSDIKRQKIEQRNDVFYTAYKYSNLPIVDKILQANIPFRCTTSPHPFLSQTPIYKSITKRLSCTPFMDVIYKNRNWYLVIEREMFNLNQQNIERLFARVNSPNIRLTLSKNDLKSGELYFIKVEALKRGYLSLIQFFDSGQLQVLIDNDIVSSNKSITFPDDTLYEGLYAEANKQNKLSKRFSKDLTLAILCDDRIDLSTISAISNDSLVENNQYLFSQLMQKVSKCSVSSDIINIKGRL